MQHIRMALPIQYDSHQRLHMRRTECVCVIHHVMVIAIALR
jgi:hypothetical protein